MGSSQPWIDKAYFLIENSRAAGEPVWLGKAVKDILREHPDCGLGERELTEIIRELVIQQRWSLDDGSQPLRGSERDGTGGVEDLRFRLATGLVHPTLAPSTRGHAGGESMGRAVPLDRDLVFTDASLAVAAARERGAELIPEVEARRILRAYPGSGVSEPELTEAIAEMVEATEPIAAGIVSGARAFGDDADAPLDLPRDRSDGE